MTRYQFKRSVHRVTERFSTGEVKNTERLADTWIERTDDGREPWAPADPDLMFGSPDAFDARRSDCIHPGLFSTSDDLRIGHQCPSCGAWVRNSEL